MEYVVISGIGIFICVIILVLTDYDIRYKGRCILHDWGYKFEWGEYWKYTWTFLKSNRRYVCKKCNKTVKE